MAAKSTTAETILAAAQRSIRRRGPQKLSLSAVAAEAGVSRPTVYRWFPTKTLLLAAIAAHEVEQFDRRARSSSPTATTIRRRGSTPHCATSSRTSTRRSAPTPSAPTPRSSLQSLADSLGPAHRVGGAGARRRPRRDPDGALRRARRGSRVRRCSCGWRTRTTWCRVPTPSSSSTRSGPSPASRRASLLVGGVRSDTYDRRVSDAEHQLLVDNAEQAEVIARLRVAALRAAAGRDRRAGSHRRHARRLARRPGARPERLGRRVTRVHLVSAALAGAATGLRATIGARRAGRDRVARCPGAVDDAGGAGGRRSRRRRRAGRRQVAEHALPPRASGTARARRAWHRRRAR